MRFESATLSLVISIVRNNADSEKPIRTAKVRVLCDSPVCLPFSACLWFFRRTPSLALAPPKQDFEMFRRIILGHRLFRCLFGARSLVPPWLPRTHPGTPLV